MAWMLSKRVPTKSLYSQAVVGILLNYYEFEDTLVWWVADACSRRARNWASSIWLARRWPRWHGNVLLTYKNRNMLMKHLINSSFNKVRRKTTFYPCMPLEYTEDIFKIVQSLSSDSVTIINVIEYCYTG